MQRGAELREFAPARKPAVAEDWLPHNSSQTLLVVAREAPLIGCTDYAASGASRRGAGSGTGWPYSGSPVISERNQRTNSASLTRRRCMIWRRRAQAAFQHPARSQNAGKDRGSMSMQPAITTRSRPVMGSQQWQYSPEVAF